VIHGPAGFGKTTLAVQWRSRLREEGKPVAWLSMDKDDNDPLRFLAYLIEAIRSAEPSLGADLVSLLESQSDQIAGFLLTELVNQLHDYGEDFYLFLDDWHLVKDRKNSRANWLLH
jgi:LuxR family maltose regulon positive regulatory protein/serine/threonine-protein kinase PknK